MTSAIAQKAARAETRSPGLARMAVTGAITAVVAFVLCWVGTFVPFSSPTHAYVGLFTAAPISSLEALAEGAFWSLLFGALIGALFAAVYGTTAALDRR